MAGYCIKSVAGKVVFMPGGRVAGHCIKSVARKGCVDARRAVGRLLY